MRFVRILLLAAGAYGQDAEIKNPHTTPADVAAGAKIFRSHCAECHGLKGEGGRGPNLQTGVFYHGSADADIFLNITDGISGTAMPGVFFSRDQVWQVAAFVRSLSSGATSAPAGNAEHGGKLFREKGCIGCHLTRGEGGFKGPDLSLIGSQRSAEHLRTAILDPGAEVLRDYWVAHITMENGASYSGFLLTQGAFTVEILDFQKGLKSLPTHDFRKFEIEKKASAMPSFKGRLSDSEVNDLVAYLWSLKRQGRTE
jgi:putative heme-binding domain-containing protein